MERDINFLIRKNPSKIEIQLIDTLKVGSSYDFVLLASAEDGGKIIVTEERIVIKGITFSPGIFDDLREKLFIKLKFSSLNEDHVKKFPMI